MKGFKQVHELYFRKTTVVTVANILNRLTEGGLAVCAVVQEKWQEPELEQQQLWWKLERIKGQMEGETDQLRGLDVGGNGRQKPKMMVTLLSWAQNTVESVHSEGQ